MRAHDGDFPYQRILEVKERREQALMLRIAGLERAIKQIEREMQRWEQVRRETLEALREERRRAEDNLEEQYPPYLEHLREQMQACSERIREIESDKQKIRREVEEVMQSRKLLEKFKERMLEELAKEQDKAEQIVLDDYSIQKHINDEARL